MSEHLMCGHLILFVTQNIYGTGYTVAMLGTSPYFVNFSLTTIFLGHLGCLCLFVGVAGDESEASSVSEGSGKA